MPRLLIFEPSLEDVEAALGGRVEPLILGRDGLIRRGGDVVSAEDAQPDIAWFSGDLYMQPAARGFAAAVHAAESLKWFQSAAAGFDNPFFSRLVGRPGLAFTTSHGQAVGIADYVLAGVLDHFQRGPERRAAQADKAWSSLPFRELRGSVWLIVGFGAIGVAVAERARSFGARIIGVRRDQTSSPAADHLAPPEDLLRHALGADVVVFCVPLNDQTRGLGGARLFAAMKPGAVFVNVGRGALVDEPALLEALDRGAPGHAVLDVFATEPLPEDSPFWTHPRVSLTAHCAGMTGEQHARNRELFLDNLNRWLSGRPLLHQVTGQGLSTI